MTENTVKISQKHIDHCKRVVNKTEFETTDEYIRYVLDELVNTSEFSQSDRDVSRNVSDQLESLGYK